MNDPAAIDALAAALTILPEYNNPLKPVYEVLSRERPLTLRAIRQHSQVLRDHADIAQDQTFAVNKVIISCQQIPPAPLSAIPLGF